MLDFLFVALMQAAMGEPQTPAEETPAPPAVETQAPAGAEDAEQTETQPRERMRCRVQAYAGSRLGQRVCSTRSQDEQRSREDRQALDALQRPAPLSGS